MALPAIVLALERIKGAVQMEFHKALLVSTVAALTIYVSSAAMAVNSFQIPKQVSMQSVNAEQERLRAIDIEMAPIRSSADLVTYLRSAGADSPLMSLSPGARERFLGSLKFNENGLVGYKYEELARELTASQAYRVLALFGAQRTTYLLGARVESPVDRAVTQAPRVPRLMADYKEFKCVGPHNCYAQMLYICLQGC